MPQTDGKQLCTSILANVGELRSWIKKCWMIRTVLARRFVTCVACRRSCCRRRHNSRPWAIQVPRPPDPHTAVVDQVYGTSICE